MYLWNKTLFTLVGCDLCIKMMCITMEYYCRRKFCKIYTYGWQPTERWKWFSGIYQTITKNTYYTINCIVAPQFSNSFSLKYNDIGPIFNTNLRFVINEISSRLIFWDFLAKYDLNINLLNVKPIFNDFFYHHITLPTRLSPRSGTLIDNFFCKFTSSLSDVSSCIFTSGISDHFPYCISINVTRAIIDPSKYIYVNNHSNESMNHFKT